MLHLNDLIDKLKNLYPSKIDLNLDRMVTLLKKLDDPHKKLPPTIHIAGTNGKGSTLAFCQSILQAADYSVHKYTSPHLINFTERIVLNGQEVSENVLANTLQYVIDINKDSTITFFEATTAAAFYLFSMYPADVLLLETGLGGRLDATNVVDKPLVAIITSIGIDHAEFLGDTLEKIALEKAGIIKPNCSVIVSKQPTNSVYTVFKRMAYQNNSTIYQYGENWDESILNKYPKPNLIGAHQLVNAATAVQSLKAQNQFKIEDTAFAKGLQTAVWPGRLQHIKQEDGFDIWVDGAHNVEGAKALATQMKTWRQTSQVVGIVAIKARKDAVGILDAVKNAVNEIIFIPMHDDAEGESYPIDDLQYLANLHQIKSVHVSNIEDALNLIKKHYTPPCHIVFFGSLYFIGEVLGKKI